MGERGSAHRASVIQIFAYVGYKRDEHGRFVARVWMKSFCIPGSRPVFLSLAWSSGARGGTLVVSFCRALVFGSRVGASFPAVVDDEEGRAGAKAISP